MTQANICEIPALGKKQQAFIARLNNGTVDPIAAIAMVSVDTEALPIMPLSHLNWESLHIRTYPSQEKQKNTLRSVADEKLLSQLTVQRLGGVDWGNDHDVELVSESSTQTRTSYKTRSSNEELPFVLTLHSTSSESRGGNDLEQSIELIPALQTFNFTLVSK